MFRQSMIYGCSQVAVYSIAKIVLSGFPDSTAITHSV